MWKNITLNSNLICAETGSAVLIKLPKSDLKFWHPAKCLKFKGKNNYLMSIGYTDNFEFNLFRTSKSDFKKKIEEKTISSEEFENIINN